MIAMRHILDHKLFNIRLGFIILCLYWLALFTGTHLPGDSVPSTGHHDKVQHFLAYFGLAVLCSVVIWPSPFAAQPSLAQQNQSPGEPNRPSPMKSLRRWFKGSLWRSSWLISVVLISYGAIDEITQAFSPGRSPEWGDFLADSLGVISGLLVCFCVWSLCIGLVSCFAKPEQKCQGDTENRQPPASVPLD